MTTEVRDWNVVVSVRENAYRQAKRALSELGRVGRTDYHNVLALRVDDIRETLDVLRAWSEIDPKLLDWFGHVVPAEVAFDFQSAAEFEDRMRAALQRWLPSLAGKRFHVRMQRRGFKHRLHEAEQERRLGAFIMDALQEAGTPGQVDFADPDVIVAIETIGRRAGLTLFTRADLERYPFLHF